MIRKTVFLLALVLLAWAGAAHPTTTDVPATTPAVCPAQAPVAPGIGIPEWTWTHHFNCRFILGCGSICDCLHHNCVEDCAGNSSCIAQCDAQRISCLNNCY